MAVRWSWISEQQTNRDPSIKDKNLFGNGEVFFAKFAYQLIIYRDFTSAIYYSTTGKKHAVVLPIKEYQLLLEELEELEELEDIKLYDS